MAVPPGADQIRRYAKKVARKANARERRLARQMQAASWLAEAAGRPPLSLAFRPTIGTGEPVLKAAGVSVPGRLCTVDVELAGGDRVLVTGPNGAGKTTLLAALHDARRGPPRPGRAAAAGPRRAAARGAGTGLLSVPGADVRGRGGGDPDRVPVDADQQRQPLGTLSAGELRRLLLATMVNGGSEVLLLDEPTNYLDFDSLDVVEAALREFRGTLVMVTHDRYFARAVGFTRWLEVRDGIVEDRDHELSATALPG